MKELGIIRKVDELGRVVLPSELRRVMDIREKDTVEISVDGECIVMKKYCPSCLFCGSFSDLLIYRGKNICRNCVRELRAGE